jgi:glycogen debranching enzyme
VSAQQSPSETPTGLPSDILEVEDRYYILATSSLADEQDRVLKEGETFVVFDRYGDIKPVGLGEEGLYHEGTRFLSGMLLRLAHERPMLLSSTIRQDNALLAVDLTNPDVSENGELIVPRGTLHISRTAFLWEGVCHQRIGFRNYGLARISVPVELRFDADFADIFEVRGTKRDRRGTQRDPHVHDDGVLLRYDGLDGRTRSTRIRFEPKPESLSETRAAYHLQLEPQAELSLEIAVACEESDEPRRVPIPSGPQATTEALAQLRRRGADLQTSNDQFNDWLRRSDADLAMMSTKTPNGEYPYAGVPWYSTVFGRDGIITAMECLWVEPEMARGVLKVLAATQATDVDPVRDAEPGKIVHEMRRGEMAALGEVPFGRYYGTADATPLFVMLAAEYHRRTADLDLVREIWPNVERALTWMDTYGVPDGDGFIEYERQTQSGLANQGWKDSFDSVFHADGRLAEGPIALCEIQGYSYAARRGAAEVARALGDRSRADRLEQQAQELRRKFEEAFWLDDLGTYAEALDGDKQPCRVRTSNAGQCLYTGIVGEDRASRLADGLLSHEGFSGWGVRTVATTESRYNPMSYHNGSVWPHDNAIIAAGMARYEMTDAALRILEGMYAASLFIDLRRLPELFCGFARRHGEGPTAYPVACSPQAWASASVFLLLQACLGVEVDAVSQEVRFTHSRLPDFIEELWISDLQVGDASLDLVLQRRTNDVGISVLHKRGEVGVVAIK